MGSYLDCGCFISDDHQRSFCPSCLSPPPPPKTKITPELVDLIESGLIAFKTLARYACDYVEGKNNDLVDAYREDPGAFADCMNFGNESVDQVLEILRERST